MSDTHKIKLYGSKRCHKTKFYQSLLKQKKIDYQFLDVEENKNSAEELRALYENGKLNFPTLTVLGKRLRNPSVKELTKWIEKLK
jgi:arsenate reductase-like glutaredoxin family protein